MNLIEKGIAVFLGEEKLAYLQEVTIGIAGLGGLGSNCAVHLVRSGFKRFVLVDYDRVDESNLNRQAFQLDQVGQLKVMAMSKNLLALNPDIHLDIRTVDVTPDNMSALFMDCDVVIEAAGTPPTWELAIDLTRKGGRVVEYGGCKGGTTITVSTERLHYHGLEIIGVLHTTPQYVRMAWDLLCTGSVDLSGTITEHTALDDIQGIYERLRDDKDQIKIALEP